MNVTTGLAAKNIRRNFMQSVLTIFGISLSVSIILAVSMMNTAIGSSVQKTVEELGTGKTGIWVEERSEDVASIGTKQEGFEEAIISKIMENGSVLSVHPSLKVYTTVLSQDNPTPQAVYLYGVRLSDDAKVRNYAVSKGNYPANENEVMIGESLAESLNISNGSDVIIQSPKGKITLKASGLLPYNEGAGTLNNNLILFADLELVQKYFGYENKVTALNIILKPDVKPSGVIEQINTLLTGNVAAFTDPIADAAGTDTTAKLRAIAFIFAFISVFIAIFLIYNTLSSSVEQSRREIGLLRLIGMTNKQIILYFLQQSLIYSIIGSFMGIFLGMLMGLGLMKLMNRMLAYESFFFEMPSAAAILLSAGVGSAATLVVSLIPSVKASKISPLSVFKNDDVQEDKKSAFSGKNRIGTLLVLGGVILCYLPFDNKVYSYISIVSPIFVFIGLCFLLDSILPPILKLFSIAFSKLFGLTGQLAVQSLQLRLKRTVVTVGAVLVAVGIFIGLLGSIYSMKLTVGNWLSNTSWADIIVFSTSGAEMDESIINKINKFEFVEKINPMRYCFVAYENGKLSDEGFLFQGFDPVEFQEFSGLEVKEGNTEEAMRALLKGRSVLINENLSNMLGLKNGDTIKMNTKKGPVDFKIVGTVVDYSDFVHRLGKAVYGSRENLVEYWGANGYTIIQCRISKGYSQEAAKKQLLEGLSDQYNIKIVTHDEERQEVGGSIDKIMSIFYTVNIIIFVIVFMGIFNTVLINVLFQIREFAVLRIVGCFARQIRVYIICEALAISTIGYLFASALGLWFSKQMTSGAVGVYGVVINYYMPLVAVASMFLITIIVSIIATLYPQKKALGTSITQVLQESAE